jgi:hypothetical protein
VLVAVAVGVTEGVCVAVAVKVGVSVEVAVWVGVALGRGDGVGDGTTDGVSVGVPKPTTRAMPALPSFWSETGDGDPVCQYAALSSRAKIGKLTVRKVVFHRVLNLCCNVASHSWNSSVLKIPQLAVAVKCVIGHVNSYFLAPVGTCFLNLTPSRGIMSLGQMGEPSLDCVPCTSRVAVQRNFPTPGPSSWFLAMPN